MLEHILRRMGFGASPADMAFWSEMDPSAVIDRLMNYESQPTNIDTRIGDAAYVGITTQGRPFSPNTSINDARQRWLFRMVHSPRQLEEKMALFWHNHFATAYSKLAGAIGQERATRAMDNDPASLAGSPPGQIQLFREHATGNFLIINDEDIPHPSASFYLHGPAPGATAPRSASPPGATSFSTSEPARSAATPSSAPAASAERSKRRRRPRLHLEGDAQQGSALSLVELMVQETGMGSDTVVKPIISGAPTSVGP